MADDVQIGIKVAADTAGAEQAKVAVEQVASASKEQAATTKGSAEAAKTAESAAKEHADKLKMVRDALQGASAGGIGFASHLRAMLNPISAVTAGLAFLAGTIMNAVAEAMKTGWAWSEASRASYAGLGDSAKEAAEKLKEFSQRQADLAAKGADATAIMEAANATTRAQLEIEKQMISAMTAKTKAYIEYQVVTNQITEAEGMRLKIQAELAGAEDAARAQTEANNRMLAARAEAIFKARVEYEKMKAVVADLEKQQAAQQARPGAKLFDAQIEAAAKNLEEAIKSLDESKEKLAALQQAGVWMASPMKVFERGLALPKAQAEAAEAQRRVDLAMGELNMLRQRRAGVPEDVGPELERARARLLEAQGRLGGLSHGGENLALENRARAEVMALKRSESWYEGMSALLRQKAEQDRREAELQQRISEEMLKLGPGFRGVSAETLQRLQETRRQIEEIQAAMARMGPPPNSRF